MPPFLLMEKYEKIYLTDTGFLLAKELFQCEKVIQKRLPAMELDLTEEEIYDLTHIIVVNLPEHCRMQLSGKVE